MTTHKFPIVLLMSIAALGFAKLAFSQSSSTESQFGAGAPSGLGALASPASREEPFPQPRALAGKEFTLDGDLLKATRARSFVVNISTLQIQQGPAPLPMLPSTMGEGADGGGGSMGSYGGMEGGGDGILGGGGMAGTGGMPGGGGAMGGMGMGGPGMGGPGMGGMTMGSGMGSGMPGGMGSAGGMSVVPDTRLVVAFIMDDEKVGGRTRIEVLAPQGSPGNYVRLESVHSGRPNAKADKKAPPLWSPAAAKLIKDTICLKIWKEDAIKTLKSEEGKGDQAAASEKLLKEVLSEEYDTQLERQHFELVRLEERLKRIQDEFTRRKQAKDRVIDVQLGKIILEAQGILGDQ